MYIKGNFVIDNKDEALLNMKPHISKLGFYLKMYILTGKPKYTRWEEILAKLAGKFRINLQNYLSTL